MADFSPGIRSNWNPQGVPGALRGISIGGPTGWYGDNTWARHLQVNAVRNNSEGLPAPCLELKHWGFWRFRWAVNVGNRSVTVYMKQAENATPRPKLIIKANPDVGLAADTEQSAGASTGWVAVTKSFVATATGVVWVELWNLSYAPWSSAFFDRITTT